MTDDSYDQLRTWRRIFRVAKFARPVLKLLGVDLSTIDLDGSISTASRLIEVRESFNATFAGHGWILHDWLNVEQAQLAMHAHQAGEIEEAERILVSAYDPDTVRIWINRMGGLDCFASRHELAMLAVADYAAERYHSCVPIALALLDGMGQELTGAGFLRQGVRFAKSGSSLEIGPGLTDLIKLFTRTRGRTCTDSILIPFRHGIMHGVDLGYANRTVAAKAWAALIAAGSYAARVEQPAKVEGRKPGGLVQTLRDFVDSQSALEEDKQMLADWTPRPSRTSLASTEIEDGMPEAVAVELLNAWKVKNYGRLAELSRATGGDSDKKRAGLIRQSIGEPPDEFAVCGFSDDAPAISTIKVSLIWQGRYEEIVELRMLHQIGDEVAVRAKSGGSWRAVSLWPLEAAALQMEAQSARND